MLRAAARLAAPRCPAALGMAARRMQSSTPSYTERMNATGRPLSPHVTIYAFPAGALLSITVRVTASLGCCSAQVRGGLREQEAARAPGHVDCWILHVEPVWRGGGPSCLEAAATLTAHPPCRHYRHRRHFAALGSGGGLLNAVQHLASETKAAD
eukprot:scaffold20725_cov111-Isochrysis_galbana.AAC.22